MCRRTAPTSTALHLEQVPSLGRGRRRRHFVAWVDFPLLKQAAFEMFWRRWRCWHHSIVPWHLVVSNIPPYLSGVFAEFVRERGGRVVTFNIDTSKGDNKVYLFGTNAKSFYLALEVNSLLSQIKSLSLSLNSTGGLTYFQSSAITRAYRIRVDVSKSNLCQLYLPFNDIGSFM